MKMMREGLRRVDLIKKKKIGKKTLTSIILRLNLKINFTNPKPSKINKHKTMVLCLKFKEIKEYQVIFKKNQRSN